MDAEDGTTADAKPEMPLVPAAGFGFLLYPQAARLVLANPPANDPGPPPSAAR